MISPSPGNPRDFLMKLTERNCEFLWPQIEELKASIEERLPERREGTMACSRSGMASNIVHCGGPTSWALSLGWNGYLAQTGARDLVQALNSEAEARLRDIIVAAKLKRHYREPGLPPHFGWDLHRDQLIASLESRLPKPLDSHIVVEGKKIPLHTLTSHDVAHAIATGQSRALAASAYVENASISMQHKAVLAELDEEARNYWFRLLGYH